MLAQQVAQLAGGGADVDRGRDIGALSAGAHSGLMGAFAIAESGGMACAAYQETVTEGYIGETPAVLSEVGLAF